MAKRQCCPECFGDHHLRNHVFPFLGAVVGNCDYCATPDVLLINPSALADWFNPLISVYEQDEDGEPITDWLNRDWQLFDHPRMDAAHAKELLADILDDSEIILAKFIPSPNYQSEALMRWETLRDEMMHQNRWFLDVNFDKDRLAQLLNYLVATDLPTQWFRARIRTGDANYPISEMGPPPKHLASHGRANPAGIPYLYLGSSPTTSTAEVRPHAGEKTCVANFEIPPIRAVDLRSPRKSISPFIAQDPGPIGQLRADLPLLERLGEELTRPVLPSRAAIDYIPSQYLCEFIRKRRFDGVVYRSSVSDGINLALFNPAQATGGVVSLYTVSRVSVEVAIAPET
ncbi:MAG: RES family NAD+ phosphorylase [Gluconobacter cerinus]|uniref:RES family NAD+ phosphorylase n=1 Tax=Gluconobacter TaxID=441 RepID=UPI00293E2CA1|nr:RES family NAD+ phosphorylase [Gluconobacter sp. GP1]